MAAIGAVFVWRQVPPPTKRDELEDWLLDLEKLEPGLGLKVNAAFWEIPLSALLAQAVLRAVASYLEEDAILSERMRHLRVYLNQPIGQLGNVPTLKA